MYTSIFNSFLFISLCKDKFLFTSYRQISFILGMSLHNTFLPPLPPYTLSWQLLIVHYFVQIPTLFAHNIFMVVHYFLFVYNWFAVNSFNTTIIFHESNAQDLQFGLIFHKFKVILHQFYLLLFKKLWHQVTILNSMCHLSRVLSICHLCFLLHH
jgi:hypothetical protein